MSFNLALEIAILNHIFDDVQITFPSLYVGLWNGDPGEIGTGGTEMSGGSYNRVDSYGLWGAASGTPTTISNDTVITFPEATTDWGTVTHFAVCDLLVGGFLWVYGSLWAPRDIVTGCVPRFDPGQLEVSLD